MVRINLLGEKVDHSATYALQTMLYMGSLVFAAFVLFLIHDNVESSLNSRMEESTMLESRLKKLNEVTKKVADLEEKRKTLREKLTTIATLKKKKNGPVHIVDDMNSALPEKAWVNDVSQKDGLITLKGVSLDNQTIAEFMSKLGDYPLFERDKIELVKSSEFIKDDIKLKEFNITVALKNLAAEKKSEEAAKKDGKKSKKGAGVGS